MKKLIVLLFITPVLTHAQSENKTGKTQSIKLTEIGDSEMAKEIGVLSFTGEKTKFKKGKITKLFQWFDYENEYDQLRRIRREYAGGFMYDEEFVAISQKAAEEIRASVRHSGKGITFEEEANEDGNYFVYEGLSRAYDGGILQATLYFTKGRAYKIYINHYYTNGQLQFVREITSEGVGQPLKNTGVLEAYFPNGSVFENPLTEDESAIIILNDEGEPEDECACMGQNIMEWGESYLYNFIGKYYYLLERIYQEEEMDCCWE